MKITGSRNVKLNLKIISIVFFCWEWHSSHSVQHIVLKTTWSTVVTAWNKNPATGDSSNAVFPQQRELRFMSTVCKQADQLQYREFCLWCTRPPPWPAPLPPLCFFKYLEWVLYEKAYLKKDLRDHWLSPTAVQLCPLSTALTPSTTTTIPPSSQPPLTTTHQSLDITAEEWTTVPAATVQL